jgi:F-type H+-transporting ATPase subunit epsilon
MTEARLRLVVFTPSDSIFDDGVLRITAVGARGAFGILPRHVDFAAPLVPGILTYVDEDDEEAFVALDGGVLLKIGATVRVATRRAVQGRELHSLHQTVEQQFSVLSEHEQEARSAIARLEAGIIRRFLQVGRAR